MTLNRLGTLLTTLLLTALLSSPALSQTLRRPVFTKWEFSANGGISFLSGDGRFPTPVSDGSTNPVFADYGSGWSLGFRVTENLADYFGAEFAYALNDQTIDYLGLGPELPNFSLDQKIHNFSYSGLFYVRNRHHQIRPYGTAGAGVTLYQVSNSSESEAVEAGVDLRNRWKFAFNFGGGVKIAMGQRWGIQADIRDYISDAPDYGFSNRAEIIDGVQQPALRPNGVFHNVLVTFGFVYRFPSR